METYDNILSRWKMWPKKQVVLEDFSGYELEFLIHRAAWVQVIAKPHKVFPTLVKELYDNFNLVIDINGAEHEHYT